jgi:alginate O-acetyltransferase complex protein AlgI
MIFQSLDYLFFFGAVLAVYWFLPLRPQNYFLLGASYFFYGYLHPWYCLLIAATTVIDYACARSLTTNPGKRRRYLALSLVSNFTILCAFKYFNFFSAAFTDLFGAIGFEVSPFTLKVLLPVGISFYTFQSASYVVDVYRGKLAARRNLIDYALFVSFFPQLVAGPIERAGHLIGQLESPRRLNLDRLRTGLFLMLWGVFKKVVIADNVAAICNKAFSITDPTFPIVRGGVFCFCIQIYADFSAYTDIARGTARCFGIDICENFRHPYLARTPADFWRRWHISLSTWFRDYVYIPLGGSRGGPARIRLNLMATFLLSGLWHVAWRFLSARFPKFETTTSPFATIPQIVVMFVLTNIGWLLFREQNPEYLWKALSASPLGVDPSDWRTGAYFFAYALLCSVPLWIHAWTDRRWTSPEKWAPREPSIPWLLAQSVTAIILFLGILLLRSRVGADFIYFQF